MMPAVGWPIADGYFTRGAAALLLAAGFLAPLWRQRAPTRFQRFW